MIAGEFGRFPRGWVTKIMPGPGRVWQAFRPGEQGDARFETYAEAIRYATAAEIVPDEWPIIEHDDATK